MLADSNAHVCLLMPSRGGRQICPSLPGVAILLLLLFFAQSVPRQSFAADVTLEEIRAGYVQTITSMPRIWTRCTWKQSLSEDMAKLMAKELSRSVDSFGYDDIVVEWATDGLKSHYYSQGGARSDGQPRKPDWFSCDGSHVWTFEYSAADEGYALWYAKQQSLATGTDSALRIKHTPGKWLGIYFGISEELQSGASLVTLLQSGDPRLIGSEEVDGHVCYRVEMTYPSARLGETLPVTAWFDPQVGYLPRKLSNDFNGSAPPSDYRVLSFRQVAVGNDGQTMWFPDRMLIERRDRNNDVISTSELTLLDVRINEPLAGDLFRPKLPVGLPAFDLDKEADVQRLLSFRSRETREKKMAELREARANLVPTAAPPVFAPTIAAEAPTGPGWPTILIVTGLLMLLVSTIWVSRQPRET